MQHDLYQENLSAHLIAIHLVFQAVALPKSLLLAGRHSFQQSDGQGQSQEVLTHWRHDQ